MFNGYGATLPNTGISAMKDIYKKKLSQPTPPAQQTYGQQYPLYNVMKNQALSMGRKMAGDTMAQMTSLTGGRPNSRATAESANAYQGYANKALDYLPQIEEMMYNREQDTYNKGQDSLNRQDNINAQLGIVNPWGNVRVTNPNVYKSSNDYMSKINEIQLSPNTDDDALLPQYYAARMDKMLTDPVKYASGLNPYKTQDARNTDFNRGVTESGLTGMYGGKPTADQIYRDKTYKLDERQTNASINNMYADNARQNQASSKYERIGPLYSQMMQSGDPSSWLAKNASIMTGDELDALAGFVPKQSYEGLTYKDYTSRGYDMMGAKNADGAVNKNQNQLNTYDWIKTLPISGEEKARLASDLGINKDLVTNAWLGR